MRFGKIDHYLLFGGGKLLGELAITLTKQEKKITVVTSPRHVNEILPDIGITLATLLNKNKIPYISLSNLNNKIIDEIITPTTLGISIGAAWIFKSSFIRKFNSRLINLHGSKLPQDRGGGGFSWRILRKDRQGFNLIHLIDDGVDTGDIVYYEEYVFPAFCRISLDFQKFSTNQYLKFIGSFIKKIEKNNEFKHISQTEYFSSYWPRLATNKHAYIDWSWTLFDIESFICAFDDPYPGAMTFLNGKLVRIKDCYCITTDGKFHPFQTGIIYRINSNSLFVACNEGSLIINKLVDKNNKPILDRVILGDRFYTPGKLLEQAMQTREYYSASGIKKG